VTVIGGRSALAVLALAGVLVAAGCGSSQSAPSYASRAIAEANLTAIDANIVQAVSENPSALPGLTSNYVEALRSSRNALGVDEVKSKLNEVIGQLGASCQQCTASLQQELAGLG
jgi:hypothetical protein